MFLPFFPRKKPFFSIRSWGVHTLTTRKKGFFRGRKTFLAALPLGGQLPERGINFNQDFKSEKACALFLRFFPNEEGSLRTNQSFVHPKAIGPFLFTQETISSVSSFFKKVTKQFIMVIPSPQRGLTPSKWAGPFPLMGLAGLSPGGFQLNS